MPSFNTHPSSYRDPSGFLFYKNGVLYRQVNKIFKKDFEDFIDTGLYDHLVDKKILIPHQTINENLTGSEDWLQTLQPEVVPFISYPYEWCFDMLKDAALLTLEAAKEALNFGMMLKDASAYNLQWHGGRMMFIDTLSFESYDEQKPWIAYRQFCEHFFAPLALMHYLKEPLQNLLLAYPDGVPLSTAKKILPFKSKLNLHTSLHIHLQASVANKLKNNAQQKPFTKQKMQNLLRSLEEGIGFFCFSQSPGVWSNYYEEANQREDYVKNKKQIVSQWLNKLNVNSVFDAGANEGEFSEIAAEKTRQVICADYDHYSINKFYRKIKKHNWFNLYPLIIDLSNPSPSIGVNNAERDSFLKRTKVDLVLALALIHHLAIGRNIPFESIAKMFSGLGEYLIIEFVPKEDEKIQLMLNQKKDVYHWYNEENFKTAFNQLFTIVENHNVGNSNRNLYLMMKRNA